MSVSIIKGENFEFDGNVIRFFDDAAGRCSDDIYWSINWASSSHSFVRVNAEWTIMDGIKKCIEDDVAAGDGDKIAILWVNPRSAAVLFLLGVIGPNHLRNAQENVDYIDIPDVNIHDRILTIRIGRNIAFDYITADADGKFFFYSS